MPAADSLRNGCVPSTAGIAVVEKIKYISFPNGHAVMAWN